MKTIWPSLTFIFLAASNLILGGEDTSSPDGRSSAAPRAVSKPCPTCPAETPEVALFRQKAGGEIVPVMVELQEPSGVSAKIAAEQAGRSMSVPELIGHGAGLLAAQQSFLA